MKITFVSNYINHHQIPFSNEMYERLGEDYRFIQSEPMERERLDMGWGIGTEQIPYLLLYYENKAECDRLILESDVVIFGGTEREELLLPRLQSGKPVIRYSERLYREGQWKAISPRGLRKKYTDHTKYRKAPVYLLCSGAYVASDFHIVRAYPKKMMKWGYFTEAKEYPVEKLPNEQETEKVSILWAGRFLELKHPEYAVLAAEYLKQSGCSFSLEMIGDGAKRGEIEKMIADKGLSEEITLSGFQAPHEVRKRMEQSNLFLFTSNHLEGWGAVLNEAMNSGCGVVAADTIGAVPYLLKHGKNGMVYREGNIKEFLEYTRRLAEDSRLRKELGRKAYQTIIKEWNPKTAAENLLRICKGILEGSVSMPETGPCSPAEIIAPGKGYGYTRK